MSATAKAIKHIKAGPLNIEVIGKIPDREPGRRRGPRQRETSKAQAFYNLKTSWQELELWIAANFTSEDMVITFTFDDDHLPKSKAEAGDIFVQKFARKLRQARAKRGEELKFILAPEGFHEKRSASFLCGDEEMEDKRIHIHAVVNRTSANDLEEMHSLWAFGGYIRAERLDLHYVRELAKYLTKEAREYGRPKPGERTWRRSRNLIKYEVEYIEIPSDSITLSPPDGAVDYVQFIEANPYGFASCVGARYLLFPRAERQYTYNMGRGVKPPPDF